MYKSVCGTRSVHNDQIKNIQKIKFIETITYKYKDTSIVSPWFVNYTFGVEIQSFYLAPPL